MNQAAIKEGGAGTTPAVAYFTNIYPSVSHTFIRREIRGLEKLGYRVKRYAVKCGENLVDPEDKEEAQLTEHLHSGSTLRLFLSALPDLLRVAGRLPQAIKTMLKLNYKSDRGIVRHLAYLFEAAKLNHLAKRDGVRHVHVHFGTNAAGVALLASILGGLTYSMTLHGPDEFDAAIGLSLCDKIMGARFVVAISDYCASQAMRWCPLDQWKKIVRVRCTVPDRWFEEAKPIPPSSRQLVCIGRLSAQKGQLLLLQAMRQVVDAGVDGSLVLVGDGEMREVLEKQIEELGLRAHVRITGWQSESQVRQHLLDSRALVMASFAEGLPMVIMEALALQRPVVVTRITGIPELVRNHQEGWKVPPGNAEELAQAMIDALTAPSEELDAMGARGAERVRAQHSVGTEVAKLDTLFREHAA